MDIVCNLFKYPVQIFAWVLCRLYEMSDHYEVLRSFRVFENIWNVMHFPIPQESKISSQQVMQYSFQELLNKCNYVVPILIIFLRKTQEDVLQKSVLLIYIQEKQIVIYSIKLLKAIKVALK